MKKIINIVIALSVFYNSGYEYSYATETTLDRSNQRMEVYNPQRSMPTTVNLRPSGSGYTGSGYDMNTGKFIDVKVGKYGDVEIFEF